MSEGQCYDSKEQMKSVNFRFHIHCNKEIKNMKSDKASLRLKCKDSRYGWYIYDVATSYSEQ